MKYSKTLMLALCVVATSAGAGEPVKSTTTCEDLRAKFQATPEAQERFQNFKGSCMGVYEVNGGLYAMTEAVVRSASSSKVTLYLPANDKTFDVQPKPEARAIVNGKKVRARDLKRGDKLNIYLSVDKFATEKQLPQVSFATDDTSTESLVEAPISEPSEPVLPTTG